MSWTEKSPTPLQREKGELRKFGLIVGGIFAAIGLWPAIAHGANVRPWSLVLGVTLLVLCLVGPGSLRPVYRMWMAAGHLLGWINTRIILGGVFYGLITPMGILMRLAGKDPMRRRFEPGLDSYRVACRPRPGSHMRRQF